MVNLYLKKQICKEGFLFYVQNLLFIFRPFNLIIFIMLRINKVIQTPLKRPIINDNITKNLGLTVPNRNNEIIKHIRTAKNDAIIINILFFIFGGGYHRNIVDFSNLLT